MELEISNASLLLPKIREASTLLEGTKRRSNFIDEIIRCEATALKQSAKNLEHNLGLAISKIQERITSLEMSLLSRNAIIPATLSTADDISVAFHIAVNGPVIDWPFAETVLERYSFLGTEVLDLSENMFVDSGFGYIVWYSNNFERNIASLLRGGDCWRVRKSIKLILKMVGDKCDLPVSAEIFDSLASVILQSIRSSVEDGDKTKWAYLIAKNQEIAVDHGILRLVNSFLYSRKAKINTVHNIFKIISAFVNYDTRSYHGGLVCAKDIPKALIEVLIEENGNEDITKICLDIFHKLVDSYHFRKIDLSSMSYSELPETFIHIMDIYSCNRDMIQNILSVITHIVADNENIPRFVSPGLLGALVAVFISPMDNIRSLQRIITYLIEYDINIVDQFYGFNVPAFSIFVQQVELLI
jgi:hypothetical protein